MRMQLLYIQENYGDPYDHFCILHTSITQPTTVRGVTGIVVNKCIAAPNYCHIYIWNVSLTIKIPIGQKSVNQCSEAASPVRSEHDLCRPVARPTTKFLTQAGR
jgi:hypothetical protein